MLNNTCILPDVVIAGAPKCATTSLFEWLSVHPEIQESTVKETCYLIDRDYPLFDKAHNFYLYGLDGYSEYFGNHRQDNKLLLEATPDYLYQETAIRVISELEAKPQVIFILRKPSERVYSLYNFARNNLSIIDKSISFSEFIHIIQDNQKLDIFANKKILKFAIRHSQYVDYLNRWKLALGNKFMHVFLFEDLKFNQRCFMISLANTLGIDPTFYDQFDFKKRNESYYVRSQNFHRLKRRLSIIAPQGIWKRWIKRTYYLMNSSSAITVSRTYDDLATLKKLDEHFTRSNKLLSEEFSLDLRKWA